MKTFSVPVLLTLFSMPNVKAHNVAPAIQSTHATQDSVAQSHVLTNVEVSTYRPNSVIRGNAIVTRIQGTPLQHLGCVEEVLTRMPGLMKMGGQVVVIGKGAPIYYINGRRVRNVHELSHISSEQVSEVEIIHSPGAQYDASTAAVVRITLNRQAGDGLSGILTTDDSQSLRYGNNRLKSAIDLNYRKEAVDLFGGVSYNNNHLHRYVTDIDQQVFSNVLEHEQNGTLQRHGNEDNLTFHLGADGQLSPNHGVGIRIERGQSLVDRFSDGMNEDVFCQSLGTPPILSDHLLSLQAIDRETNTLSANAYYSGRWGKWSLDWEADHFSCKITSDADIQETALSTKRNMLTSNNSDNRMWATKMVMSHPIGYRTKFQIGTEMSWVRRSNEYLYQSLTSEQDDALISNADNQAREENIALFAEWQGMSLVGMFSLGLRYEHVGLKYDDHMQSSLCADRHFDHIFPSASLATRFKEVQVLLSYRIKTQRPSFSALRSNVEYLNRFTLSTGDPTLRNELTQQADLNLRWRYLSFAFSYQRISDAIMDWFYLYDNQGGVLSTVRNLTEPMRRLSAFAVFAPTRGCWHPNYTAGIQKQWLHLDLPDPRIEQGIRTLDYDRPMWIFFCQNAFVFTQSWQLEINGNFYSKAHWGNAELTDHFFDLNLAVQKSWLPNNALTLRLSAQDLFQRAKQGVRIDLGNYTFYKSINNGQQRSVYDSHCVALHLSYKFNSTKSRYKGQHAGKEIVDRIKKQ